MRLKLKKTVEDTVRQAGGTLTVGKHPSYQTGGKSFKNHISRSKAFKSGSNRNGASFTFNFKRR